MAEIVRMPKLYDTMTDGVLIKWHKSVGDFINKGDVLAEIETDKVTAEFESNYEGVLLHKAIEDGLSVSVDGMLAIIGMPTTHDSREIEMMKVRANNSIGNQEIVSTSLKIKRQVESIKEYTILHELGQGGMATVFLGQHKKLHNKVAIKVLSAQYVGNVNIRKRFLAEARNMARMKHDNIIRVSDLIDEEDIVAIVMEYVEGETLKSYLERRGKITIDEIKGIFSQMLDAVGYVHDQLLVHRDIKPSNFMIDKAGRLMLLDFGIAKTLDPDSAEYTMTGTTQQMGTPMYMSPEQVKSSKDVTAHSDIYSLGVVLWQMVTGKKPYDTTTMSTFEMQMKVVTEPLPETNSEFEILISQATQKDIINRFASIKDFNRALRNLHDYQQTVIGNEKTVFTEHEKTHIELRSGTTVEDMNRVRKIKRSWMMENLSVDHFRNGDPIPEARTHMEWAQAGINGKPAWCYYLNDPENDKLYGKLYNWYAVSDPRGLTPEGWEIPTDEDWKQLIDQYGGDEKAAYSLKDVSSWKSNSGSTNESGFTALPGGFRYNDGSFSYLGIEGYWWTLSKWEDNTAVYRVMDYRNGVVHRVIENRSKGMSVRCIKSLK